ncbi:hypothetical protein P175DRAFT_0467687 [Aspergillus ochraceoroseus IBT 24754]|uniref:Uncharacterized protein n=2 Tax=Aspergillus ochraceoroseus TaxID=138278 RepID=A0A2T5LLK4_9EURO|nr:uncharacterized protein P175DRAFT_0467687 [Aspergillus ochraceoroseus IBT 24754]KKK12381.1 hypothetical protein AOCH_001898 [Aspergillus ochraceoroseus]PTU17164.1 hypothetical protein P175DRAFT_0467687 [Aspergillus ochraceoroseus IBT 24754]
MSREAFLPSIQTKTTPGPAPGGLGRGLFASADVNSGDDILHIQSPFVAVLDTQRLEDTCSGCFGRKQLEDEAISLRGCTGCQVVKYCDRTCQAKDWKSGHSLECSIFQKLTPRVLPNNARAVLRMVLRSGRKKYTSQESDLFVQLETHIREIRDENPAQWERIALSSKAVKAYSGTDMEEETISAFGAKLDLNSFNLTNVLYDRVGLYLHPYASLINHSCDYNSVVGFDGDELFIKAVRPIKKDQQIFISYIDATNPTHRRKKELRERYFFTCECLKCSNPSPSPNDIQNNLSTPTPTPTLTLTPAMEAIERRAYSLLDSSSAATTPETTTTAAATSSEIQSTLIRLLQSQSKEQQSIITTQPLISLRDELIATLIAAGKFKSAFLQAAIRYLRIDPVVYPYDGHPLRYLHAWALARLAMHLSQHIDAASPRSGAEAEAEAEAERLTGLDFSLVVWVVLRRLLGREEGGCTVPGFRRMVRRAFVEVRGEFVRNGVDLKGLEGAGMREWGRVEEVVAAVLGEDGNARELSAR